MGEARSGEANLNRGFGQSPPSLPPAATMVIMGGDMMTGTMSTFSFSLLEQFSILTKIG
ncbi:MAG: hypothetical protein H0T56_09810 [Pseudaminobacter sp.]|nr:hypothetical protein [Pseudaminobacter sp.]